MEARISIAHGNLEGMEFDVVADCGGDFYLLEQGDDLQRVVLYEGGEPIDLTDLDSMCYEYVDLSEDEAVFDIYWGTGDEGGPSFFILNEPWIGESFRRSLLAKSQE
ncbi:hypothetical protein [Geobacter anodireducens]|nr:hypothetical protein [Geobacter soli]